MHLPDPVDIITQRKVQIVEPIFRQAQAPFHLCMYDVTFPASFQVEGGAGANMNRVTRDYGGHIRFNGQATTVKCFENNPLVRKVRWNFTQHHAMQTLTLDAPE